MRISVIIPTKNRKEDLLITLNSIVQQSRPPDEIVIVDQSQKNCKEEILELLKADGNKLNLIYLWDKDIPGLTEARIIGSKKSSGEILFFLDDDMTLDKNCIKNLLQTYEENPHLGGVGGVDTSCADKSLLLLLAKSLFTCGPFSLRKGGWFFTGWVPHYYHNKRMALYPSWWFLGGIMSFKRCVVKEIGFNKEPIAHGFVDVIDFTFRASGKYCLVIDPKVKGYHRGGRVALYNIKENYERRISGEWYFFIKYIEKTLLNILLFIWSHFGRLWGTLATCLRKGSLDPLRGFLAGIKIGATQYRKAFSHRGATK